MATRVFSGKVSNVHFFTWSIKKCEVNELERNHIEEDTKTFLHPKYISEKQDMLPIVTDAEDTSVMCLSSYVSTKINLRLYL